MKMSNGPNSAKRDLYFHSAFTMTSTSSSGAGTRDRGQGLIGT